MFALSHEMWCAVPQAVEDCKFQCTNKRVCFCENYPDQTSQGNIRHLVLIRSRGCRSTCSTSRKWLPPPRVPSCWAGLGCAAASSSQREGACSWLMSSNVWLAFGMAVLWRSKPVSKTGVLWQMSLAMSFRQLWVIRKESVVGSHYSRHYKLGVCKRRCHNSNCRSAIVFVDVASA